MVNYLNEFIGISPPERAWRDYDYTGLLLQELSLEELSQKACPPSTVMTCLGVEVNSTSLTLSVNPKWLTELEELLLQWTKRRSATKSELQLLVGKLSFVSKCVWQSCLFLSHIFTLLRSLQHNHHHMKLSKEYHRDIHWWLDFLRCYNGVSVIPSFIWSTPDRVFATDTCLSGCGGLTDNSFFLCELPSDIQSFFSCHSSFGGPCYSCGLSFMGISVAGTAYSCAL